MPLIPKQQPPYYTEKGTAKIYKGLITQSGTAAPTIIELINTLSGIPTKTRFTTGEYYITLTGEFPEEKTTFYIQNNLSLDSQYTMYWVGINTIGIGTGIANTPTDGQLSKTPFQIIIYP